MKSSKASLKAGKKQAGVKTLPFLVLTRTVWIYTASLLRGEKRQ